VSAVVEEKHAMKIALSIMGDERWMAGEVIVRNLFASVGELNRRDVKMVLLAEAGQDEGRLRQRYAAAQEFLFHPVARRFSTSWFKDKVTARVLERDRATSEFLLRHEVDTLFGSTFQLRFPGIATLSWLADFQHVHLPEMFDEAERANRDRAFERATRLATRLIVLSEAVAADVRKYYPAQAAKVRVLSPITRVPSGLYQQDPRSVVMIYNLPEKFFYLPNQFWQHKNHALVFQAIRTLKDRGVRVTVVCTGYPGDYRNMSHFTQLWENVSRWNIRDQVIYLGLIPHDHVMSLIRQSICVISPSRFEGWGIGVDEARSIGKRVLVSDLAAHREQDPPRATFVDPQSPDDMVTSLAAIWNAVEPGPDREMEEAARALLPGRIRAYAEKFLSVAQEARGAGRSP
jgi:glycosyltransferase involved in cell wall biosynthesis